MKHIFELRMKDQIEKRSSQLLRNLSSCEKKAGKIFFEILTVGKTAHYVFFLENCLWLLKADNSRVDVIRQSSIRLNNRSLMTNVFFVFYKLNFQISFDAKMFSFLGGRGEGGGGL